MEETSEKICNFLKEEFAKKGKSKVILGISGGIDSTTTAFLCKKAGLDLHVVVLPYNNSNIEASMSVVKALNLPEDRIFLVDIGSATDAQIKELSRYVQLDNIDKGNIMARQRMVSQYALARKLGGLVIGTENLSEYYLGYFTLFGDQACDISAISNLFKTQVLELARYLGVPEEFVSRTPTAGLWVGQTDETEFGFSYKDADQIIEMCIIKKEKPENLIKKGFDEVLINKVLERVKATEYKRQSALKLTLE